MTSRMKDLFCFFVVIFLWSGVTPATILMLPIQLHSHISNFVDVGSALVQKGHEVYTVSYQGYRQINQDTGIQTIILPCRNISLCTPDAIAETQRSYTRLALKHKGNMLEYMNDIIGPIDYACREMLTEETFWNELNKLKFDLVFVDGLFSFRCMYLIPHRLGVPWITLADFIDPVIPRLPWLPSFVPHPILSMSDSMTFTERLENTMMMIMFHFSTFMPALPPEIIEQYNQYGSFKSLEELEGKSLFWLHTHDDVLDYPRPYMPNVVNVGGLSTKAPKPLSHEFKTYIEQAKHGVILVSFGSYLVDLPDDIAMELLVAFEKLKENVIWRFANVNQLNVPQNVKLTGWLPQNDLLAHKKVLLFITHCGNNGRFEGLYHGKPMLGVPIYGDQLANAASLQYLGFGKRISIFDITSDNILKAIREIIDNPVYQSNIDKAASIFHSRPETPVQRAVFWIEHVLKYGGNHLRSHALDMPLYQYFMLDVILFVLTTTFIVIYLVIKIVKYMLHICVKIKNPKTTSKPKGD